MFLINAATADVPTDLTVLKENVIIGRKIPVGTGAPGLLSDEALDEVSQEAEIAA